MTIIYITFGAKYRREPHPTCGWVDPRGYLTVVGDDYDQCRQAAYDLLGGAFAFDYLVRPTRESCPLGELALLHAATGDVTHTPSVSVDISGDSAGWTVDADAGAFTVTVETDEQWTTVSTRDREVIEAIYKAAGEALS